MWHNSENEWDPDSKSIYIVVQIVPTNEKGFLKTKLKFPFLRPNIYSKIRNQKLCGRGLFLIQKFLTRHWREGQETGERKADEIKYLCYLKLKNIQPGIRNHSTSKHFPKQSK